mmetsp:Transcript_8993/g.21642  ORF Transcript_8993/g.21642 Transcript_8993/m.21642 type:complete len:149 (+) Transcript_8993:613-1059(+)
MSTSPFGVFPTECVHCAWSTSSRPDLTWPVAMRPFCMWDLQRRYMLGDQVLMFPRAAMNEVFEACQEDFMIGDLKFEGGNAMIPAQITRKNKPGVSGNKGTRLICEKLNLLPGPSYYKRNFQLAGLGEYGASTLCANLTYANPCANAI